jgi:transcription elongation factor GreA
MSHEVLLSQDGYERLKKELEFLKGPERTRIAENIREAKSHGDLRENAMYHEAKLNQTRLEARISELDRMLQVARIVEEGSGDGSATLGSKVTLEDLEFGDTFSIELVGAFDADPANDKISVDAPLGKAVLARVVGDEISVEAPAGVQNYKIVEIA